MKKVIMALALAAVTAAPAFAATHHKKADDANAAYAAATDSTAAVVNGQIVGRDPDPRIRFELMRDLPTNAN